MPRIVLVRVLFLRPWWHGAICVVVRQTSLPAGSTRRSKVSQPQEQVLRNQGENRVSPLFVSFRVSHLTVPEEKRYQISLYVRAL